jgi:hypothetical protein
MYDKRVVADCKKLTEHLLKVSVDTLVLSIVMLAKEHYPSYDVTISGSKVRLFPLRYVQLAGYGPSP